VIMRTAIRAAVCAGVLAAVPAGLQGRQAETQPAAAMPGGIKASVDQLAWIAGPWRGTLGDRTIEQHWMSPIGGSMVAMYRSIREGRATLYELLAIEQQGDQVWLRIKHFSPGPGLVSQEAKEESANHVLVSVEERTAVFEAATPSGPVRVTFRSPDPQTLTITVARQRSGKPTSTDFNYKRLSH
jgi:hypothetical protein